MATKEERARSFGAIAADYDRLRPTPPAEALDWLVPPDTRVAVDVAAGTGLFTRALADRVDTVIAVEPDPQMRAVLAQRSPDLDVRDGIGEAIPVDDASADAVFVASAWHWLDESRAVPEIARVLRDGGRLGVLWSSRDRELDWVRELDLAPGEQRPTDAVEDQHRWRREVADDGAGHFVNVERRSFAFTRRMTPQDVVDMVATYSRVITASEEVRAEILRRSLVLIKDQYGEADEIDFPMRTWCWRGDRVARG